MIKRIGIFGSTGSIGKQALEVIKHNPDKFSVEILTANSNYEELIEQAIVHDPNIVVIGDDTYYEKVKQALSGTDVKVFAGEKALEEVAAMDCYDMMLAAIVGFAGLKPTLKAIQSKKAIALANKETLVVAGDIVMDLAVQNQVPVIPVDSEHSAIFQCLVGETRNKIEKIYLTASGGPFLGRKTNFLVNVKREHALQHPNWQMGAKISVDSATLMNKGLEMIEAKWLFNLQPDQIEVLVHPQSAIHSMVQFEDGSLKAQLGVADMRLPIQYALAFPHRIPNEYPRFSFRKFNTFTFEEPDLRTFRNLALSIEALEKGGNLPCVMNAANEIAVYAFLKNKIGFLEMTDIIEAVMGKVPFIEKPSLDDYLNSDAEARTLAADIMSL
ncbi:1-deoxy-D-xylulose-5-phosphate reductoisomerase [Niabella hibiscisoli]|uniref:1-deoxy-D-xylulose-5-phosphate reductoisomerase n=1 Tax=Niabella hibiscisoli TaxID=1825928 RepID=UPI001F10CFB7|nr:1-deoxy-D-xylulose-5-phosphate reductoisomerase [Niabella hibiscisoli]MCH5718836.1 1-deoxy-D-xylulose-5-phosphate reductoisomerase [Niabella hibiscisoli]